MILEKSSDLFETLFAFESEVIRMLTTALVRAGLWGVTARSLKNLLYPKMYKSVKAVTTDFCLHNHTQALKWPRRGEDRKGN